jgi:hypothetical protein
VRENLLGDLADTVPGSSSDPQILGVNPEIQRASVTDPVTKGKRLPNFWAAAKAIPTPVDGSLS